MLLGDSLTNLVSGLGTDKDKVSHSFFRPSWLGKWQIDAMYDSDWLSGKIVDIPPDDMTREWRQWSGGPRQVAALMAEEKRLGIKHKVNAALKLARKYGGAGLLLGDGAADPTQPLNIKAIRRGGLQYVHALSRYELWAADIDRDPLSPGFGEPMFYQLGNGTRSATIHPSRVVRFLGHYRLELSQSFDGWGMSVLQRVHDAVRNVATATGNAASLTHEAKIDVVSIPGLSENSINPDYQAKMLARFGLANLGKSVQNMLLLDAEETWSQKQITFAGIVDMIKEFLEVAAAAADITATRLLSTSPKGMNSTGSSDTRNYYDMLVGKQVSELDPSMERLDEVMIRSAIGSRPATITYQWNPLWQMTEAERAALDLQNAQTDEIYAVLGGLPPSAMRAGIRGRMLASGSYPGLQDALDKADAAGEQAAPLVDKKTATGGLVNPSSSTAHAVKT